MADEGFEQPATNGDHGCANEIRAESGVALEYDDPGQCKENSDQQPEGSGRDEDEVEIGAAATVTEMYAERNQMRRYPDSQNAGTEPFSEGAGVRKPTGKYSRSEKGSPDCDDAAPAPARKVRKHEHWP
ncbi:hypothetical protein ACFFRE_01440 [Aciditerrimonas ferrireducens]|uniref:Uncharacterized protein n=1 Tax=Aciditerrimonas ferrireducens TaxID=667306 RepID=A0ABV6BZG8_9ACTN